MPATAVTLDMTNVKDGVVFNKKHYPEGDYPGKVMDVQNAKKKDDPSKKMWLFTIKVKSGVYPFYCGFGEKELWKIRNLFVACGVAVPKKRLKIDPNKLVGRDLGVTLQDTEYDGKIQSEIGGVVPLSELGEDEEDEEEEELEEEEEPEPPKKSKKGKKSKAKLADEDVDEDELEELDIDEI